MTGSGAVEVDRAKAMRFDLVLSGSGRLTIGQLDADAVTLGQTGSGTVALSGKAKTVRATVQGSGNLEAANFAAEDLQINADTSGAVGIKAARAAKVAAMGSGDVVVLGSPACTVTRRGSGQLSCGKSR